MVSPPSLPVVGDWFDVTWVTDRLALIAEPCVDEFLAANVWFVAGRDRDLLVDAGNGVAPLLPVVARLAAHVRTDRDTPQAGATKREVVCVATHAHADHVGGFHEFADRRLHRLEAEDLSRAARMRSLLWSDWAPMFGGEDDIDDDLIDDLDADASDEDVGDNEAGGGSIDDPPTDPPPLLLTALPREGFDPYTFRIEAAVATELVAEGDELDLGDRRLRVIELPGHTPGSIGLVDKGEGVLFSGDAAYEGGLIDTLPESDVARYLDTMERLRDLSVEKVYPGHGEPFGRVRLRRLAAAYLRLRG